MTSNVRTLGAPALRTLALATLALAQHSPAHADTPHHIAMPPAAVTWGPAPPSLPPGAQAAVLLGHPAKEGPFVLRLKFPSGFTVPPHRHSKDELVTVLAGRFEIGAGEKLDRAATEVLPTAGFAHLPAGMPHFALTTGETIVQINGMGPFDIEYVNPADDPRAN